MKYQDIVDKYGVSLSAVKSWVFAIGKQAKEIENAIKKQWQTE